MRIRRRSTQGARAASLGLALSIASSVAHAQDGGATDGGSPVVDRGRCPVGALGCASSPIEFRRREGLPVELDVDTGWVPASAPVQVRLLPVASAHENYAASVVEQLRREGFRVDVVHADDQLGKRIRNAKMEKIPYVLVVGDDDANNGTVGVNPRGGEVERDVRVDAFVARVHADVSEDVDDVDA